MRAGPSESVLATAAGWTTRMSSWLGSSLLAGDVPVISGRASAVGTSPVPEKVSFRVPPSTVENGRTVDWLPRKPGAALARFGQVVDLTLQVGGVDVRINRYLIDAWDEQDDGSIAVEAVGMLKLPEDDRLLAATGPRDDGTLKSELLRMLPGYMTAGFDPALVDRPVPRTMEWDENRLKNLYAIADAWPARIRTDVWGQVRVLPPLPQVVEPVITFTDGDGRFDHLHLVTGDTFPADDLFPTSDTFPGEALTARVRRTPPGTLMAAPTSDSRSGAHNVFVARSSADGVEAQAVARVQGGPMDPTGPYRPVPKFLASPLFNDETQCLAAAIKMRDESVRSSRIRKLTFAPDPRVELDDPVEIITGAGTSREFVERGYVVGYDIPLTVNDGPGRADVAVF
ncbi:hypothetical protein [Microbacterium thalli]|uniref:Uncharacterized protein n=1 Tax=Microbacterium thalli TaxID=3027921 RepID=A0ABT5SNE4_9MICO|nr:hypothetical protein [Microbacterium thalli]MDD7963303.1 hypothetical protein [Microbacterium thalli]